METGSCVPVIGISPSRADVPSRFQEYLIDAMGTIMDVIEATDLESLQHTANGFPTEWLAHFKQFGKNLNEGESLTLNHTTRNMEVTLTPRTRRTLLSRIESPASDMAVPNTALLRGSIPAADQQKMTFEFLPIYGQKVTARCSLSTWTLFWRPLWATKRG